MILICTDDDLFEDRRTKETKDIKLVDLNIQARFIWDTPIILFSRGTELKLLKTDRKLPEFVDNLELHL